MEHRAQASIEEFEDLLGEESSTMEPVEVIAPIEIDEPTTDFANLTQIADEDNDIGLRMREIQVLEKFLKAVSAVFLNYSQN